MACPVLVSLMVIVMVGVVTTMERDTFRAVAMVTGEREVYSVSAGRSSIYCAFR